MYSKLLFNDPSRIPNWRGPSNPVNVLVVGNNPIAMGSVHDLFKSMRGATYQLEFAFDAKEGQKRIQEFNPHAVVIDSNLGDEDQAALLSRLRGSKFHNVQTILLAGDEVMSNAEAFAACIPKQLLNMLSLETTLKNLLDNKNEAA